MILYGEEVWYMSAEKYVRSTMENVGQNLTRSIQGLPTHCKTPIMFGYQTETDTFPENKAKGMTKYQVMVRVTRWAVELGRVGIILKTALISTYLALSYRGHLKQVFHVFRYLKANLKINIFFDPQHLTTNERLFSAYNWYDFYRDSKEAIPADAPTPMVNVVSTHCFVDADHARNRDTRISQTGVLIFVNKAPILYYIKRQNTVDNRMFLSKSIAINTATEIAEAHR